MSHLREQVPFETVGSGEKGGEKRSFFKNFPAFLDSGG